MKQSVEDRFSLYCAIMDEAESATGIMIAVHDDSDIYLIDKHTGKKQTLKYRKVKKNGSKRKKRLRR